jgi:hypothetical protein
VLVGWCAVQDICRLFIYNAFNSIDSMSSTSFNVHLPNDTLSLAFENTLFLLIPKQNATITQFIYSNRDVYISIAIGLSPQF